MALDLNALNAYGRTNTQAAGVGAQGGVYDAAQAGQGQARQINVMPGQVLGGEVMDVKNGEVTLRLDNNATITASLDQNIDLSVGQKLMFQVTGNGEQTSLHPLYTNLSNNTMANAALNEAGLKATAANLAMVTNMIDEGMSVNRQALLGMARIIDANPVTDPATLVQLTKLGLPVNELNIEQYENYKNFEHQIINDAQGLSTGLSELIGTSPDAGAEAFLLNNAQLQLTSDILSLIDSGGRDWNAILNNPQITGTVMQSVEIAANGPVNPVQDVPQTTAVEVEDVWAISLNPDSDAEPEMNTSVNMGESTVGEEGGTSLGQSQMQEAPNQLMQGLADELGKLGMPSEELRNVSNGTMNVNDLVDFVKTMINNSAHGAGLSDTQAEALNKLLNNPDFKQLVGNQLMKQMLLNPADVAKDGEVEALYKRLAEQSQRAIEILTNAGQSGSEVMKSAQNINDNVNFMNQLNHMMAYVQLPIRMNQENAHGELYVYTKKKQLRNNDGNVSAFLHLDMDNLGPMDVYVAMQKNKVNTNFYLADEEALDLIMEHIDILDDRLTKRGYNMTTSVTMKNKADPPKTVVGEMLREQSNGIVSGPMSSRLSFDIRA
ncbi:MAG: flagellar hook-length control protein FliK [Lachnospiraceae bacterium]|nr:flagellar hook-length control protein FliK [Lachnospiraceae bacterium]